MSSGKLEGIYVELDSLLDTRIGTIVKLYGDDVALAVLEDNYHNRQSDIFKDVDPAIYKKAYAERDTDTLQYSHVTDIICILQKMVGELTKQALSRPYHNGCRIYVNTHPYDLTEEEHKEIIAAVKSWVGLFSEANVITEVITISLSLDKLIPTYCRDNFSGMIMYEYEPWFAVQCKALSITPLPSVTLYVPAIYFEKVPTEEEIKECIKLVAHPFHAVEIAARPFIGLEFIDIDHFSLVKNKTA
jgi:hypothetical protein